MAKITYLTQENLTEVLEDDRLKTNISQNYRAIALEEYSLELHIQRYIELYSQALQN